MLKKVVRSAVRTCAVGMIGVLALTGCSNGQSEGAGGAGNSEGKGDSGASEFVVPKEKPTRVVATSSEVSDMALLLTGADNMAAVSASSKNPHMGMVPLEARKVENTLPPGVNPDAEQILAFKPDLVLTTVRHGGEKSAAGQLHKANVPVLQLSTEDFSTPEKYAETLKRVGEALHEEDKATSESDALLEKIKEIDDKRMDAEHKPSALALMARGDKIMVMDSDQMLPGLAIRAGAKDATETLGIENTSPIDAEKLVKAQPDIILLEDFMGKGQAPFDSLLKNPAVAQIPAVKNKQIHVVPMTEASGVAGVNLPTGYQKVLSIVAESKAS